MNVSVFITKSHPRIAFLLVLKVSTFDMDKIQSSVLWAANLIHYVGLL